MKKSLTFALAALAGLAAGAAFVPSAEAFVSSEGRTDRAQWLAYLQKQAESERGMTRDQIRERRVQLASLSTNAYAARQIDPQFLPTVVEYNGRERPGTIVIDTEEKFLYLVEPGGKARRYGVGVGRPGFQWAGTHRISRKAEWPGWTPPPQMRKRQPELPAFMEGGPDNPLGARALYLGSTLFRIHGSNAPWTIGHEVSSGCFRMRNEDVIDLYERVGVGTTVIVRR